MDIWVTASPYVGQIIGYERSKYGRPGNAGFGIPLAYVAVPRTEVPDYICNIYARKIVLDFCFILCYTVFKI